MLTALDMAIEFLKVLPGLLGAGEQTLKLVTNQIEQLKAMQAAGRDPTDAEWEALHAQLNVIRSQLL